MKSFATSFERVLRSLPERVVIARLHSTDAMLGDLADQRLRQRLVVGNRDRAFGRSMLGKLLAKRLEAFRHRRETQVRLVRRKSEQKSRLDEKRRAPLDRLRGFRRDALEDRVQPAKVRLPRFRRGVDVFGNGGRTFARHVHLLRFALPLLLSATAWRMSV